jgi:hypothetical protein
MNRAEEGVWFADLVLLDEFEPARHEGRMEQLTGQGRVHLFEDSHVIKTHE